MPTEKEINAIIKAVDSPENPGETHLTKFMAHLCPLLMDRKLDILSPSYMFVFLTVLLHRMEPASPKKLLEAFEVLDPENKRFLTKEYFGKLMREEGEAFDEEEIKDIWPIAIDPITGNIPYIYYINKLKVCTHKY